MSFFKSLVYKFLIHFVDALLKNIVYASFPCIYHCEEDKVSSFGLARLGPQSMLGIESRPAVLVYHVRFASESTETDVTLMPCKEMLNL